MAFIMKEYANWQEKENLRKIESLYILTLNNCAFYIFSYDKGSLYDGKGSF